MKVFQENLFYSREHIWVHVDGDIATIGVTDYAQELLGEVVEIELPTAGTIVERDEVFGSLEATKGIVELIAPLTGDIISVNEDLTDDIGVLNSDPQDTGWLIVIEIKDATEIHELLLPDEYHDFVTEELGIG
ncbi:MAG: glycine cleavage system protein GcvH [Deltaproteobacteria bacterium]